MGVNRPDLDAIDARHTVSEPWDSWEECQGCRQRHYGASESFPVWPCDTKKLITYARELEEDHAKQNHELHISVANNFRRKERIAELEAALAPFATRHDRAVERLGHELNADCANAARVLRKAEG